MVVLRRVPRLKVRIAGGVAVLVHRHHRFALLISDDVDRCAMMIWRDATSATSAMRYLRLRRLASRFRKAKSQFQAIKSQLRSSQPKQQPDRQGGAQS